MRFCSFLLIACFSYLLTACSSLSSNNEKSAYCNKLKSDIVFSGATGNTRKSEIEASEEPLAQRNFDQHDC